MENYKTPEQLFMEEHPEVEKYYIIAVTFKGSEEYGSQFCECYLERPTNEDADLILDGLLANDAEDMYEDEEETMSVDIQEVTVKHTDTGDADWDEEHFDNEYCVVYNREYTIHGNGKRQ